MVDNIAEKISTIKGQLINLVKEVKEKIDRGGEHVYQNIKLFRDYERLGEIKRRCKEGIGESMQQT